MNPRTAAGTRPMRASRPAAPRWRERPWWPWALRTLGVLWAALVIGLLWHQGRTIDWTAVRGALAALPLPTLGLAALLALTGHALYGTLDLAGRHTTGHRLSVPTVHGIGMTSYAFTLSLGSLVGGVGVRYRMYAQQGLDPGVIAQVVALSVLANWLGYLLIAGGLLWVWPLPPVAGWSLPRGVELLLGGLMLLVPLAYAVLCLRRGGRALRWREHRATVPHARWALAQCGVAALHWALMGATLAVLLQGQASPGAALATVLVAAVAGLVVRIPAGLGVLEAVGLSLLASAGPRETVLGVLLAFRGVYYLAPLGIALLRLGLAEGWAWHRRRKHPSN